MLFSNSINTLPGDVFFNESQINRVFSIKFLGLYIDEKLNWKQHTNHLCKLLSRNAGVIYKLKSIFPRSVLKMLYSTLFLPYLNYGVLALGKSIKMQTDKLLLVQKRVMRVISDVDYLAHTNVLFYENKILKIDDIYYLQLGTIMYDLNAKVLPQALASMFRKNNQVHSYPTRQALDYHLPLVRTKLRFNSLIYTGPQFWNSLESDITQAVSLFVFKRRLKLVLLNRYCVE